MLKVLREKKVTDGVRNVAQSVSLGDDRRGELVGGIFVVLCVVAFAGFLLARHYSM